MPDALTFLRGHIHMARSNRFVWTISVALAVLASPAIAATNIIDSTYGIGAGSFELGSFTARGPENYNNFQSLLPTATNLTGWTIGGVGVDWLAAPYYAASDGVHAVDLGYYDAGAGTISTSIATIVGATYNLSFSAAAVPGFSSYTNAGHVNAGSLVAAFAPAFSAPYDFTNQIYTDYSFNFVAQGATTSIVFAADNAGTAYGPVIDNVSASFVSAPNGVPEPKAWAMFISGFGLIGAVARRKRLAQFA